jgi:tetratricopeptide (TPR) repeat protein
MKTASKNQIKPVINAIQSGKLEELALTADQLAALKHHQGNSALHICAQYGCLDQIKGGVTASQLSQTVNPVGVSALLYAAHFGCLHQVKGGVTAGQLKSEKNEDGISGLMYAAQDGYLHQIAGDITAADLAGDRLPDNTSALHHAAFHGQLYLLKGGVTADELVAARVDDGNTALHAAAGGRCLDDIKGGVTFEQLTAIKDDKGKTPLYWAAREGSLNQIRGGVTMDQMNSTLCYGGKSAWAIACENLNDDQIAGSESALLLAEVQKDFGGFLPFLQLTCEDAIKQINGGDRRLGERLLIKLAIDSSWNGQACGIISDAYQSLGNNKDAFRFAVRAVDRAPEFFPVWLNLGFNCLELNKHQQAVSALEHCLRLNPRCAPAMSMLALAKYDMGHPVAEIEALSRKAVETDPECLAGWQWLAAYLESIGKHEESDQAHYEFCKLKLGSDAAEFGFAEGLPIGLMVSKDGAERHRKEGLLVPVADPSLN